MLNPLHLRTLVAVVESGSFADAARRLDYTSSAVSQHISSLERSLKLTLFERSAQSIRPTPVGRMLAEKARTAIGVLRQLEDELLLNVQGKVGQLRMGSFPTASEKVLPAALVKIYNEVPLLEILLDEGEPRELTNLLLDGDLDFALVYHYDLVPPSWPRELERKKLFKEQLTLILPERHPLARKGDAINLSDLRDESWIAPRSDMAGATCLYRLCAMHDFEPRIVVRSNDYDVVRAFVKQGLGVALVPALSHVDEPAVATQPLVGYEVSRHVSALYRPVKYNPLLELSLSVLSEVAGSLEESIEGVLYDPFSS